MIYIAGSIYTLFLTYLFSRDHKLQLHPMTIVLAVWTIGILLTGIFGYGYEFHLAPFAYILALITVLSFMAIVFSRSSRIEIIPETPERSCTIPFLLPLTLLTFIVGAAGVYMQAKTHGFDSGDFVESSVEYTKRRYNDEIDINPLLSIYYSLANLTCIITGLALAFSKRTDYRRKLLLIAIAIAPSILYTLISTSRLFTLLMIFNVIGGFIAGLTSRYSGSVPNAILWSLVRRFSLTAISLAVLVVSIQVMRQSKGDFSEIDQIIDHLRPWLSGYIPGFSIWWSHNEDIIYYGEGTSFALLGGTLSLAGFEKVHSVPFIYLTSESNATTNALTILHFFIQDLGIVYSLPLMIFCLLIVNFCYSAAVNGSFLGTIMLGTCYSLAIMSINSYPFTYGSCVLGLVACFAYGLLFNKKITPQFYDPYFDQSHPVPVEQYNPEHTAGTL